MPSGFPSIPSISHFSGSWFVCGRTRDENLEAQERGGGEATPKQSRMWRGEAILDSFNAGTTIEDCPAGRTGQG